MLAVENEGERFLHQERTSFSKIYKSDFSDLQKNIYIYIFVSLNLQFSKYIVPNSREKGSSKRGTAGVSTYYLDEEKIF